MICHCGMAVHIHQPVSICSLDPCVQLFPQLWDCLAEPGFTLQTGESELNLEPADEQHQHLLCSAEETLRQNRE